LHFIIQSTSNVHESSSISKTAKEAAPNEEKQKYAKSKMRKQTNVMSSPPIEAKPSKQQNNYGNPMITTIQFQVSLQQTTKLQ
jgi:hypothetical protein